MVSHVRVYQYNIDSNEWEQIGKDIDGEAEYDYSGSSVSLSSDGNIVAIVLLIMMIMDIIQVM